MYVFCVIIPLFITDAVIVNAIYDREYDSKQYQLENIANQYISSMKSTFEYSARVARAFSGNHELYRFLDAEYETPYDYFEEYYQFINKSFFKSLMQTRTDKITIYVDNPTISSPPAIRARPPTNQSAPRQANHQRSACPNTFANNT